MPWKTKEAKRAYELRTKDRDREAKTRTSVAWNREHKELVRQRRISDPDKYKERARLDHQKLMSDPGRLEKKRAHAREQQNKYRHKNPRLVLSTTLRSNYGITLEDYEALLLKQNNACAICSKVVPSKHKAKTSGLGVDHCHKTGVVRGLLCRSCNFAIGLLDDHPDLLLRAATYLKATTR